MNRDKTNRSEAEHARIETEIGHILATEEELMPSSGFAASVMERVRQEAALPAPLPFLGLPVFSQLGLNLAALNWPAIVQPHLSADLIHSLELAGWVALALGISLASWLLSRQLAGRGGLL